MENYDALEWFGRCPLNEKFFIYDIIEKTVKTDLVLSINCMSLLAYYYYFFNVCLQNSLKSFPWESRKLTILFRGQKNRIK